ncbi:MULTISPECIES: aspartate kinase [unclassified Leeuwenhoekiella]|uniref:aspartate kinase n=1 Tax=unclassified Leeuwenhoekiella TaxID=2615029 RepID=UPI000C6470F9|nr:MULTISPECIES: aspartate kinase [unclassified Leeuwenhoekiella]MAW96197.1 aspartate kinase [Leeuwenhoekiella sp.]MBA80191.1 aspartate kinase [Leeuwenhoekiella sp.]|tara:strand:- start:18828 stop:20081 length:1254 start_codon:yes stop_codon:yes gene_type:complete
MGFKVYKFGGASVKDAAGVRNVARVLKETETTNAVVVVSAMGKMTNAFEEFIKAYFEDRSLAEALEPIEAYHHNIALDLFGNLQHPVFKSLSALFSEIDDFLKRNKSPDYDYVYDQLVVYGELLSTTLVSHYFNEIGLANTWHDVRNYIKTNTRYREGKVEWELTMRNLSRNISKKGIQITQGFIASDPNGFSTTLGREGSDYSAAIIAYCLNAESVTIWKDVPGVMSGDPRYFENAVLLQSISYTEAVELAFYGASVIHPKTLQPLQRKEIPLYVKSFLNPADTGTQVCLGEAIQPKVPCYILKREQVLLSLSSLDFSFMDEDNIGEIFKLLGQYKLKVDMIQNSAISFSVCVEDKYRNLQKLVSRLKADYKVTVYEQVFLYTLRHPNEEAVRNLEEHKEILLKQVTQNTVQLVSL